MTGLPEPERTAARTVHATAGPASSSPARTSPARIGPVRTSGRPGRLTADQVAELRALYAAARRSRDWADVAIAFNRLLSDSVSQTRIGAALGVSASHVHDIESTRLPAGYPRSPVRDYSGGDWVATSEAARLLNISRTRLTRRLSGDAAAAITCRAGRLRVWHADSLAAWWSQAG